VDFRELVRELARILHIRVEMRQIGTRDAAKMIGGIGACGYQLCCNRYIREFTPVSIKMAKDQDLVLNPEKVSGVCGRLMCCLAYENDVYKEAVKSIPKLGHKVITPEGEGRVRDRDILRGLVKVQLSADTGLKIFHVSSLTIPDGQKSSDDADDRDEIDENSFPVRN
jgi:cell fate regulator YaaT (PSP1 superfamily)